MKKTNTQSPLVVTGYILFSLLVIGTLASTTIPFAVLLFNPKVLHVNVAATLVALTIGALLPVLLGYSIGDHSVKTKSKLSHHFTGILFGLLAYWIMIIPGVFMNFPPEFLQDNRNARILIMNLLPGLCVAIITSILAVAHVRSRYAKQDILKYRPFAVLLVVAIVAMPLWSLIHGAITNSVGMYSFVPLILVAVSGIISYVTLHKAKLSTNDKVVWSAVSVSVLFVAMYVLPQFISTLSGYFIGIATMEVQAAVSSVGFVLTLTIWGVYWLKQVKALR